MISLCSSLQFRCCLLRSLLMLQPPETMRLFLTHTGWRGHGRTNANLCSVWILPHSVCSTGTVVFFTDNQATSKIINKGRSGSLLIMGFIRRLIWLSLQFNFHIYCRFINDIQKTAADDLSRFNFPLFFQMKTFMSPFPEFLALKVGLDTYWASAVGLMDRSLSVNTKKAYNITNLKGFSDFSKKGILGLIVTTTSTFWLLWPTATHSSNCLTPP